MTWLTAVVLRPFGALLLFGLAAFVACVLLRPLIPSGRVKDLLYDRSIRKRHPWRFAILGLVAVYGVAAVVAVAVLD